MGHTSGMTMGMFGGQGGGGNASQVIECAKAFVGKIIGRGGETIAQVQQQSGAKVQIDQNVPEGMPCKINIQGNPQTVQAAVQIVQDIMMGTSSGGGGGRGGGGHMGHMGGGGMGMHGQGGMGMMQGGGGGFGMQGGGGGYGGGYGMPQQQQPPSHYGAPAGYGHPGMQQQQPQQYAPATAAYVPYATNQQQHVGAPVQQPQVAAHKAPLPPNWTEYRNEDNVPYWYNSASGLSTWDRPHA